MKVHNLAAACLFVFALTPTVSAAEPITIDLAPQIFSYTSEPGTLRAGVRWGRISVRGHDGYEVLVSARVIPENGRRYDRSLHDLINLRVEERNNIMDLRIDSELPGFYGVELEITVPTQTRLELEMTGGGDIFVAGVSGVVDVANHNGSVELTELGSNAVVDARNGSITATFDAVDPELPMAFSTLNGSVDVTLPEGAAADLRIRHTYGGVESDFPLRTSDGRQVTADLAGLDKGETRVLSASLNGGGPRFDFFTANGTVYLRRGGVVEN
jgi:hypothetical protein